MAVINVQFSDVSETVISSFFSCAQDITTYPNQSVISDTDSRYLAFLNPVSTPSGAWQSYQSTAQQALTDSDMVAIRCAKAGIAYPAAWLARDVKLRAIVSATSGDPTIALPVQPPYPTGT